MKQRKEMINNLLSIQIDNSEIYNSQSYERLMQNIIKYEDIFADKLDNELFSEYREIRIDAETLFYYFGFVEGLQFAKFLSETQSGNLVDGLLSKDN